MIASWHFAQWGLDIIGLFLTVARQLKFLVVGIDYFTKWVEAEALATIMEKNVRSFVWRNIICRSLEYWSRTTKNISTMSHSGILLTIGDQESLLLTHPPSGQQIG